MNNKETKIFSSCSELKTAASNDDSMTFSGYGAYFNNVDSYGDVIVPGAFKSAIETIRKTGEFPAMLAQHGMDSYTPVGVYTEIREDEKGLYVEGKLADTQAGRDLYALMKMTPRPAINGMSIGFFCKEAEYPTSATKGQYPEGCERIIKSVDLLEISLVTFPANKKATVQSVKSEFVVRDTEKALKEAGYSASEAKTIISIIKKANGMEDVTQTTAVETVTSENLDVKESQVIEEAKLEEEISEDIKSLISFMKDMEDPESAGMELSDSDKDSIKSWIDEKKKENELNDLLAFMKSC